MCGRAYECLHGFVRCVFVSPFSVCARLFAKAEKCHGWRLSEVIPSAKRNYFLLCQIEALRVIRARAHVQACVSFMCFSRTRQLSPKRNTSGVCVLIPVYQSTWRSYTLWNRAIYFSACASKKLRFHASTGRADSGSCHFCAATAIITRYCPRRLWVTLDNGEIDLNTAKWLWLQHYCGLDFTWNLPRSRESNYLLNDGVASLSLQRRKALCTFPVEHMSLSRRGHADLCGVYSTKIAQKSRTTLQLNSSMTQTWFTDPIFYAFSVKFWS